MGTVPGSHRHDQSFRPFDSVPDTPVPLLWPTLLDRRATAPLVYLDLNHWIGLADASVGRRQGDEYKELLLACRTARSNNTALFPLSATHYMEISKIVDPSRRANLAAIMEELSNWDTLVSRVTVMRLEIEAALDAAFGERLRNAAAVPLLGKGVFHSVGVENDLQIVDAAGADATALAAAQLGEQTLRHLMDQAQLALERAILAGPRDDLEAAELRSRGWRPDAAVDVALTRADREKELARELDADPRWRRGRLRDVVSARELIHELLQMLTVGLVERGATMTWFRDDRPGIRKFVRSMPSTEVAIEMKMARHQNPSTVWDTNTIFDIDAMALAVPYCDVVATERHAWSVLTRANFADRMQTALLRRPEELVDWITSRRATAESGRTPRGRRSGRFPA